MVKRLLLLIGALLLLNGCMLMSGEAQSNDRQTGSGNFSSSFVSAEGGEARTLQVADEPSETSLIAVIAVETGDLQIDVVQPDGSLAFSLVSRPGQQVTRSGLVRTDQQGRIHYRVFARGARNGSYQLLFQGE